MNDANTPALPWIIETSDATFDDDVLNRSRDVPVVVDFWASWCQPCQLLAPILEQLAREFDGKFVLVKADTEKVPQVAARMNVQSIPAVFGVRDGQVVDFFQGLLPEPQLRSWLERLLPTEAEWLLAEARALAASDSAAAEGKVRQAIALDDKLAPAKIALADLLLAAERYDESAKVIAVLEQRGFLEPEAEKIRAAIDLHAQGALSGGVESCRAAVEQNPSDMDLRLKLAEALAAERQFEEALEICLKLVQEDRQGQGESARQLMVDIFRLLPEDSELTGIYRRKLSAALY